MNEIVICIPNYNGGEYLSGLQKIDGADVVVMDNASTDDSVRICWEKGIEIIENDSTVDRTQNWLRCLDYFRNSRYKWMKWLFIGDELSEDAVCLMQKAIKKHKSAAIIVFRYAIVDSGKKVIWSSGSGEGELSHAEVTKLLMEDHNVFGAPMGVMISKEAVQKNKMIELHGFQWLADLYIHYQIAKNGTVCFEESIIGKLMLSSRKHYFALRNSIWSNLETLELLRLLAKENRDMGGDIWGGTELNKYLLRAVSMNPKHKICGKMIRMGLILFGKRRQTIGRHKK